MLSYGLWVSIYVTLVYAGWKSFKLRRFNFRFPPLLYLKSCSFSYPEDNFSSFFSDFGKPHILNITPYFEVVMFRANSRTCASANMHVTLFIAGALIWAHYYFYFISSLNTQNPKSRRHRLDHKILLRDFISFSLFFTFTIFNKIRNQSLIHVYKRPDFPLIFEIN